MYLFHCTCNLEYLILIKMDPAYNITCRFNCNHLYDQCRPSWLVDKKRIATKIRNASTSDPGRINWQSNPTRACPNCQYMIDNSDVRLFVFVLWLQMFYYVNFHRNCYDSISLFLKWSSLAFRFDANRYCDTVIWLVEKCHLYEDVGMCSPYQSDIFNRVHH